MNLQKSWYWAQNCSKTSYSGFLEFWIYEQFWLFCITVLSLHLFIAFSMLCFIEHSQGKQVSNKITAFQYLVYDRNLSQLDRFCWFFLDFFFDFWPVFGCFWSMFGRFLVDFWTMFGRFLVELIYNLCSKWTNYFIKFWTIWVDLGLLCFQSILCFRSICFSSWSVRFGFFSIFSDFFSIFRFFLSIWRFFFQVYIFDFINL